MSRIGLRTRWFDQGVVDSLTPGSHPLPVAVTLTPSSPDQVTLSLTLRPPACQVVLLAAGMDARAWRLPLPPGTPVFELDKPDVVAAKATMLQRLLVQTAPGQADCAYPLHAGSWTSLAADLTDPTWVALLQAGGFDRTRPSVCTCASHDGVVTGLQKSSSSSSSSSSSLLLLLLLLLSSSQLS